MKGNDIMLYLKFCDENSMERFEIASLAASRFTVVGWPHSAPCCIKNHDLLYCDCPSVRWQLILSEKER